jgi:hypothetical protein
MFSSTHRLHDLFRADAQEIYQEFTELEIIGRLEDLLELGWTWNEFHSLIGGKVVWTARNMYVAVRSRQQYSVSGFHDAVISIDTTFWVQKLDVFAPTPAQAQYTLNILLQLLAVVSDNPAFGDICRLSYRFGPGILSHAEPKRPEAFFRASIVDRATLSHPC